MSIQTQTKNINGKVFSVTPFLAMQAFKLKNRILRLISPAIAQALGGISNLVSIKAAISSSINGGELAGAIQTLFINLDEDTFDTLVKELLSNTTVAITEDKPKLFTFSKDQFEATFNLVFQGSLMDLYALLFFILQVNYPDFFEKIQGSAGKAIEIIAGSNGQV